MRVTTLERAYVIKKIHSLCLPVSHRLAYRAVKNYFLQRSVCLPPLFILDSLITNSLINNPLISIKKLPAGNWFNEFQMALYIYITFPTEKYIYI